MPVPPLAKLPLVGGAPPEPAPVPPVDVSTQELEALPWSQPISEAASQSARLGSAVRATSGRRRPPRSVPTLMRLSSHIQGPPTRSLRRSPLCQ